MTNQGNIMFFIEELPFWVEYIHNSINKLFLQKATTILQPAL